jgi:hypothetical protein
MTSRKCISACAATLTMLALVCLPSPAQTKAREAGVKASPQPTHDKAYLISLMQETVRDFVAATGKANDAQWRFKPAPDRWSLSEVAEHLILSEIQFYSELAMAFNAPAHPELSRQTAGNDSKAIDFILEEGKHISSKMVVPLGSTASRESLLRALGERREMALDLIRAKTDEELRTHMVYKVPSNATPVRDAYQECLVFALHMTRHMRQVDSIFGDPKFPR